MNNFTKFTIKVLGCKVNQHDAASIKEFLQANGFIYTNNPNESKIFIINTCTVTLKSDVEARKYIRHIKSNYPTAKIIITGCYAQRASNELTKLHPDAIIGNLELNKWKKLLATLKNDETYLKHNELYTNPIFPFPTTTLDKTRIYLKIQDGCNNACSYCIIPNVRGKSKSLPIDVIINRLKKLISLGYKEIIITGINLALYGYDLNLKNGLYLLSKEIEKINENFRVRLSSIEPSIKSKSFFDFALNSEKIVPHFHLPIQYVNQRILQDMNRPYSFKNCLKLIEFIHKKNNDACIGADIIVGFPTETNKDFNEAYELLENLPLSYMHIFTFSPRPNTKAFNLKNCTPHNEISNRTHQLIELSKNKFTQYKMKFIGKKLQMLTFRYSKNNILPCLSNNFIHAKMMHINKNIPENNFIVASLAYTNNEFISKPI